MERLTKKAKREHRPHIAWKKVFCDDWNEVVIQLETEEDFSSSPENVYECISHKAKVLAIYDMDGYKTALPTARSYHDRNFEYVVGKTYTGEHGIWCRPSFDGAAAYWKGMGEPQIEKERKSL